MNKVAIAFLTKDKVELSTRTVERLFNPPFSLFWFDGSSTDASREFFEQNAAPAFAYGNVVGGPDAAVAFALTTMLEHKAEYTHIGLCENDVLLTDPDWFDRTMALFDTPGLHVGAASPRCYEDRVLTQRDGYAVMHNLGWGCQIMTREAAALTLRNFRTSWTFENRRMFAWLAGVDIGVYWAFRTHDHNLCADWGNDRMLASYGLASLALTPSPVEMIGQDPPLELQGLRIVAGEVDSLRNDVAFDRYRRITDRIWQATLQAPTPNPAVVHEDGGASIYFAHQMGMLEGCAFEGDWRLKWTQGFGPFAWRSNTGDEIVEVTLSGPCEFLVSGGQNGGMVKLEDLKSGYTVEPKLPPDPNGQVMSLVAPSGVSHRPMRLTMLTPGCLFYGVKTREPQPERWDWTFDHSFLPRV